MMDWKISRQYELDEDQIGETVEFMKEGLEGVQVLRFQGRE